MSDKDGGSAFPHYEPAGIRDLGIGGVPLPELRYQGMSLRDYFAAEAMPSAIAHELSLRQAQIAPGVFRYDEIAKAAYIMADAMIAERAKA